MSEEIQRQKLFEKYLRNECNNEEREKLISYFQGANLSEEFPGVDEVLRQLDTRPELTNSADRRIYSQIVKSTRKRRSFKEEYRVLSVAAVFIGLLLLSYFYQDLLVPTSESTFQPQENHITLRLESGQIQSLYSANDTIIFDTKGNKIGSFRQNKLVYSNDVRADDSLVYNELTVPYGKTFDLLLADGTSVNLNAGTSIRYPVHFIEGQKREVFLQGEAYFDVARDEQHPFIVNADQLKIEVLGTQFSVMAYLEDPNSQVVLVEGAVGMSHETQGTEEQVILSPGERGVFDKTSMSIITDKVPTSVYTSWVHGELVFRDMSFDNILSRLERHYDVDIENYFKTGKSETFNANFGKEPIEQVLEYFNRIYSIEYIIEGDKVLIK